MQYNNREYYTNCSNNLSWPISRIVDSGQHVLKRSDVQLKAPIHNPEKLICIGMNYVDHCLEQNVPLPTEPILFSKFNNAITDPGAPIIYPDETQVCFIVVSSINLICILKWIKLLLTQYATWYQPLVIFSTVHVVTPHRTKCNKKNFTSPYVA